jgi:hypothetical protein
MRVAATPSLSLLVVGGTTSDETRDPPYSIPFHSQFSDNRLEIRITVSRHRQRFEPLIHLLSIQYPVHYRSRSSDHVIQQKERQQEAGIVGDTVVK